MFKAHFVSPCLLATAAAALALCVAPDHAAAQALPSSVATPAAPKWLLTADLNHDGIPDIAYQDAPAGGALHVLIGSGGGSFAVGQVLALPDGAAGLTLGDVNRDGIPDLLLGFRGSLCATPCAPALTVLLGNGDGSFQPPRATVVVSTASPVEISPQFALADFDGDGLPDIVYADGHQLLYLLKGNGDGSFAAPVVLSVGAPGTRVFAADLNGDGRPDLILPAASGNAFAVRFNQGRGVFAAAVLYTTGVAFADAASTAPDRIALADVDGDGHPDVLFTDENGIVRIAYGRADGSFAGFVQVATVANRAAVLAGVADLNGDHRPRLFLAGPDGLSLALGATPADEPTYAATGSSQAAVADFNGDGYADVAVPGEGSIVILYGNADGSLAAAAAHPAGIPKPAVQLYPPPVTTTGASPTYAILLPVPPSTAGANVTLTAIVESSTGITNPAPSGTVTFGQLFPPTTLAYALGTVPVGSGGIATLNISTLPVGNDNITCFYSGDGTFASSNCTPIVVYVSSNTSTLTLTSTGNPAQVFTPITFTANLSSNGVPLAGAALTLTIAVSPTVQIVVTPLTTDANGNASYTNPGLASGTYSVSVGFAGTAAVQAQTTTLTETVNLVGTSTKLTASPSPDVAGQTLTLSATVTAASNSLGYYPAGSIAFAENGITLATIALTATSVTTATASYPLVLAASTYTLTATYVPATGPPAASFSPSAASISEQVYASTPPTTPSTQDFSLAAAPTAVSTQTGHKAATQLTLSSIGGFGGPINLACAQPLPLYVTCELPSPLTLAANGTASTTLVLATDAVPNAFGRLRTPAAPFSMPAAPALAMLFGLPLLLARRRHALRRGLNSLLTLALLAVLATALAACGLGTLPPSTPPGTYTIPVTASSGALSHSVAITLTVTP